MSQYERPNIAAMQGYAFGEQPQDGRSIKLNTNENPYPPSPKVAQALTDFATDSYESTRSLTRVGAAPGRRRASWLGSGQRCNHPRRRRSLRLAVTTFVSPDGWSPPPSQPIRSIRC